MTHSIPRTSAIALSVAALVSLSPLSADTRGAHRTEAGAPQPAPTPWAESGPGGPTVAQHPAMRHYRHPATTHSADTGIATTIATIPVATAATGVAGGVADLGSIAAYPFYCFPNYGSCSVRVPYRY